jgi:hypothetical protein
MSDQGSQESGARQVAGCGCFVVALLCIGVAAVAVVSAFHPVDAHKQCGRIRHDYCLWRAPAKVVSVDSRGRSFRARAENGLHKVTIGDRGALPAVGERVTLEIWFNSIVSFTHTATGRRVHTDEWKEGGTGRNAVLASVFGLVGLFCIAYLARPYVRRRRARA